MSNYMPKSILPASGIDRTQPRANVATVAEVGVTGTYRERTNSPLVGAGFEFCAGGGVESRHAGAKAEIGCREPVRADSLDRTSQTDPSGSSAPPARTSLSWAAVQLPEHEYLALIVNAIELADTLDDFRVIRAAIAKVRGAVNRQSLRMMLELREKEVAHE